VSENPPKTRQKRILFGEVNGNPVHTAEKERILKHSGVFCVQEGAYGGFLPTLSAIDTH
jgi:hypothetical protein